MRPFTVIASSYWNLAEREEKLWAAASVIGAKPHDFKKKSCGYASVCLKRLIFPQQPTREGVNLQARGRCCVWALVKCCAKFSSRGPSPCSFRPMLIVILCHDGRSALEEKVYHTGFHSTAVSHVVGEIVSFFWCPWYVKTVAFGPIWVLYYLRGY